MGKAVSTIGCCWSGVNSFAILVHFSCSLCRDPDIHLDMVRFASISVVVRYTLFRFAALCKCALQRSVCDGLRDSQ